MQSPLQKRLRRAAGQLDALIQALDNPVVDCRDVLIRAKTIRQALDGFASAYIEEHIDLCIRDNMQPDDLAKNLETALKYFS